MKIFQVDPNVLESDQIQESTKEALKIKSQKQWLKELKQNRANVVLMDDNGQAFQATTFLHKMQIYAGIAPNLIQAYFDLAYEQIQWTDKYADTFHFISNNKFEEVRLIEPNIFNRFIQYRISSIIFLHLSVEAFVNHIIPDDFIYLRVENSKSDKFIEQTTKLSKENIERWTSFKEKIEKVIPQIPGIDFDLKKNSKILGRLFEIVKIRDEIIHLKSKDKETSIYYDKIFNFIASKNLSDYLHSVKKFINIIQKDFIKIESIQEQKISEKILMENPKQLHMGMLFDVVRIKEKRITIEISKWDGLTKENESLIMILSHLELMKKMNILDDYLINESKSLFTIEIFKLDKQIT
ncbi:hypothetical protein [Aquimarina intermedia]|nr:hypothetical protein [Aquimarina intermedia]